MRERNISKNLIIETFNYPDKIILQANERVQSLKLRKRKNKKYLSIVIYQKTKTNKKIITAFITSKINKYLL